MNRFAERAITVLVSVAASAAICALPVMHRSAPPEPTSSYRPSRGLGAAPHTTHEPADPTKPRAAVESGRRSHEDAGAIRHHTREFGDIVLAHEATEYSECPPESANNPDAAALPPGIVPVFRSGGACVRYVVHGLHGEVGQTITHREDDRHACGSGAKGFHGCDERARELGRAWQPAGVTFDEDAGAN